jgi:threonine dehydrogenase-like Zn-dependent dehydrogenase
MNLIKSREVFDPIKLENDEVIIIGCGAIGSTVALMLTRMGVDHFVLYDMDTVSEHNLANQNFTNEDVGENKTTATARHIKEINPEAVVKIRGKYEGQRLEGYVFLAVDNIETRKEICVSNKLNRNIKYVFDFRMGLYNAQHYAADWNDEKSVERLLQTMDFSHKEAKENTPMSPCGTTLNVITTVMSVVALGCTQFIKAVNEKLIVHMIVTDVYNMSTLFIN